MFGQNIFHNILGISIALIAITIAYFKWAFAYWRRKGLETPSPSMPFGNMHDLLAQKTTFSGLIRRVYEEARRRGRPHGGMYFLVSPVYVPADVEVVKNVLQKDFGSFVNRGMYVNERQDALGQHLFNIEDARWKELRGKLTQTFTSGKMRMMFETLVGCGANLVEAVGKENSKAIDIKEMSARFTTDAIGTCAFGIECNSFEDPNAEFRRYGKKIFEFTLWESVKFFATFAFPRSLLRAVNFSTKNEAVSGFFTKVVTETVAHRESHGVHRKDFLHLLLQLKNRGQIADDGRIASEASEKGILTLDEVIAQVFIFFAAGFETSSTTMSFALYELAKNPSIQKKLRLEVVAALEKCGGVATYEGITEMPYLDKVVNETLRKYPPLGMLLRMCNEDYRVPATDVVIEKGTRVFVSVEGLHNDPAYYPNPETFDPERFSEENRKSRPAFSFLPFGEGPRVCIGLRFGLLQVKVGLVALLGRYSFDVDPRTESPLTMDPKSFVTSTKKGIYLNARSL